GRSGCGRRRSAARWAATRAGRRSCMGTLAPVDRRERSPSRRSSRGRRGRSGPGWFSTRASSSRWRGRSRGRCTPARRTTLGVSERQPVRTTTAGGGRGRRAAVISLERFQPGFQMRPSFYVRAALVLALLPLPVVAQRGGGQAGSAQGNNAQNAVATNPQADLPYGAPSAEPVSKWTPPASVGRQLTLHDLMTWKTIRNADLSNDGKWFAYILAPNEGDAEVIIRGTAAGASEMKFPIGDPSGGGAGGGGRGGAGGGSGLSISGNNRWVAFMV